MWVVKPPHPDRLPFLDGPYMSLRVLDVCTASVSSRSHDGDKDDMVSSIKEVTRLKCDCLEAMPNAGPRGVEGINAYAGPGLNGVVWVDPLDGWIEVSRGGPQPGLVPGGIDTANDLHVLLRHRPRSIPQAQGSA